VRGASADEIGARVRKFEGCADLGLGRTSDNEGGDDDGGTETKKHDGLNKLSVD
jgi:hypothetical protein